MTLLILFVTLIVFSLFTLLVLYMIRLCFRVIAALIKVFMLFLTLWIIYSIFSYIHVFMYNSIVSVYYSFTVLTYKIHVAFDISSHWGFKCLVCKHDAYYLLSYDDIISIVHGYYNSALDYMHYIVEIRQRFNILAIQ